MILNSRAFLPFYLFVVFGFRPIGDCCEIENKLCYTLGCVERDIKPHGVQVVKFITIDPLSDRFPYTNCYLYCNGNPLMFIDPDGMNQEQRDIAVQQAYLYVKMNKGNSYQLGAKNGPGHKVDCSGLASWCIMAAGEENPVGKGVGNGVHQIVQASMKVDLRHIEEGNVVVFGSQDNKDNHIGVIVDVIRDDDGNIVDASFVHSSCSNGPTETKLSDPYWGPKITGYYKWDTISDKIIDIEEDMGISPFIEIVEHSVIKSDFHVEGISLKNEILEFKYVDVTK